MHYFEKLDGTKLPVSEEFLLPFLSPTSPGTNYWEGPPPSALTDRQLGRILLQAHQVMHFFQEFCIPMKGKKFCDIGTGNGMIPRLLLNLTDLESAVGADPFYDGEHKTSWQKHDHFETYNSLLELARKNNTKKLSLETYADLLEFENFKFQPGEVAISKGEDKSYEFFPVGAHDLENIGEKFDIFYCKAIEHIPDWPRVLQSIERAANSKSVIYFKHRSFFSFLGPHRYSSTMIPWGHVLLTDEDFRLYAKQYHSERYEEMIRFFFSSLAYPRYSVSDLLRIAAESNFKLLGIMIEPPRYLQQAQSLIKEIPDFYAIVKQIYPNVSVEELFSGIYHILLTKD